MVSTRRRWSVTSSLLVALGVFGPGSVIASGQSSRTDPGTPSPARADSTIAFADSIAYVPLLIELPDSLTTIRPMLEEQPDGRLLAPTLEVRARRLDARELTSETIHALGRAELERFQPATVADALVAVPGVDLQKTGAWSVRPTLRGLGGNRILLKIDGVRVNPVRGHGPDPSIAGLDRVENVEVRAGASAAQDGTDALAGVIDISTQRPLLAPHRTQTMRLQARASTPGEAYGTQARWSLADRSWGVEVGGGIGRLDALETPGGSIANSGYRDESVSARLEIGSATTRARADLSRYSAYDVGLPAFASASGNAGLYPLRRRDAVILSAQHERTGLLRSAHVLADFQDQRAHFTETVVDSAFVRGNYVGRTMRVGAERVRTWEIGIAPEVNLSLMQGIEAFGELRWQDSDGPREDQSTVVNRAGDVTGQSTTNVPSMPRSSRALVAAGANAARYLGRFRVDAGLRYDRVRSRSDEVSDREIEASDLSEDRTSASLGVSRGFGPARLYARTATGFRTPALDERFYNGFVHGALYLFGNVDLVAERSWSNEVGIRLRALERARIETARLSFYRSDVEDLITFRYVDQLYLVPRFQYQNIDEATLYGVELSAALRIAGARVVLNAGLPEGEDDATGERIATLGPARCAIDVAWPVERIHSGLELHTRARWSDALGETEELLRRPAFWTTHLEIAFRFSTLRAALSVRNLFDHAYSEPLSAIPEPGRTVGLSVTYEGLFPSRAPGAGRKENDS